MVIGVWESLDIIYKAGLIAILGILNFYFVYNEYKQPNLEIEKMLELMVKSLWGPVDSSHFRSNVMVYNPKTEKLQIKYRYNMMGAIDRDFKLAVDQGCAGRAFKRKKPFWVDILESTHEKYLVDSGQVWSNMKSVMSVPIFLQKDTIGVLNIDSDLDMNTSRFNRENVYIIVNAYADIVATVLERRP
jgi:transcriptional regulator with GAF, ATPase, and Fis domain